MRAGSAHATYTWTLMAHYTRREKSSLGFALDAGRPTGLLRSHAACSLGHARSGSPGPQARAEDACRRLRYAICDLIFFFLWRGMWLKILEVCLAARTAEVRGSSLDLGLRCDMSCWVRHWFFLGRTCMFPLAMHATSTEHAENFLLWARRSGGPGTLVLGTWERWTGHFLHV